MRDCGQPKKPTIVAKTDCVIRPVHARVRGRQVRSVTFYLDGRHFKTIRRPDARGRFGVLLDRHTLEPGTHLLRAKVVFKRRAHRRPEFLKMTIRRCLASAPPEDARGKLRRDLWGGAVPRMGPRRPDPAGRLPSRRQAAGRRDGRGLARPLRTTIDPSGLGRGDNEVTRASNSWPGGSPRPHGEAFASPNAAEGNTCYAAKHERCALSRLPP